MQFNRLTIKKTLSLFKRRWPFFRKKGNESPASDEKEASAIPIARQPGLNCPRCRFRIIISIPMLLSGEKIVCPSCQLKLEVDKKESNSCLKKLGELQETIEKVESMKKQTL